MIIISSTYKYQILSCISIYNISYIYICQVLLYTLDINLSLSLYIYISIILLYHRLYRIILYYIIFYCIALYYIISYTMYYIIILYYYMLHIVTLYFIYIYISLYHITLYTCIHTYSAAMVQNIKGLSFHSIPHSNWIFRDGPLVVVTRVLASSDR